MNNTNSSMRRDFMRTSGAALTTSIFTGKVKGANDRISAGFIGMGLMGMGNLEFAMKQPGLEAVVVCDCYQPNLEKAVTQTGGRAKGVKDFREILADKSVDVVCICTPDHWHAHMTVEACKAGKDVYIEKPLSCVVEEGRRMVEAAREHNRVVQVGTMQRSGVHFQRACEIVRNGQLGRVTFIKAFNYALLREQGMGNPPDTDPPPGLDWDMWLGPAPWRPYNKNRFGAASKGLSTFRWFWDYAGGMLTDWGVHWLDIVQMALNEATPEAVAALGGKYHLRDNRETPDTMMATFEYPGILAVYELHFANSQSMFSKGGGILFHGTKGTLFVDRAGYQVIPEGNSDLKPVEEKASNNMNLAHWANFVDCVRSRKKPLSDIEIGHRSTTTCLLGNVSMRSKTRIDWDGRTETTTQRAAQEFLTRKYREPWKLAV